MLTRIWVRNLACFGDDNYRLDLSPETVLVGPNNVGKSVMIGAYNFVRQFTFSGSWEFDTASYRWESIQNIAHRHDNHSPVEMGISLSGDYTGDLSVVFQDGRGSFKGSRDNVVREELRKGWYFAASRNEIPRQMQVGIHGLSTPWNQPLNPDGSNVVTYLLERYTSRDRNWDVAENWLKRVVPEFSILKSPLRGAQGSIETEHAKLGVDINLAYQGTGTQKVLSTIAALVFSPEGSTIIIEEPEIHLHPRSQEVLVDLFNLAVNEWGKQVIFTTHSWDMLLPFVSDIGTGTTRGKTHNKADPNNFRLVTFAQEGEKVAIRDFDLKEKDFVKVRTYFKQLWG